MIKLIENKIHRKVVIVINDKFGIVKIKVYEAIFHSCTCLFLINKYTINFLIDKPTLTRNFYHKDFSLFTMNEVLIKNEN
jgi:hypothetical protein